MLLVITAAKTVCFNVCFDWGKVFFGRYYSRYWQNLAEYFGFGSVNTVMRGVGEPPEGRQAVCVGELANFTQTDSNAVIFPKKKEKWFETYFNPTKKTRHGNLSDCPHIRLCCLLSVRCRGSSRTFQRLLPWLFLRRQ